MTTGFKALSFSPSVYPSDSAPPLSCSAECLGTEFHMYFVQWNRGYSDKTVVHSVLFRLPRNNFCFNLRTLSTLLYFSNFSSVIRKILEGRGMIQVTWACKQLYYIFFKGLLAPLQFSSKRYHIPFCSVQKGNSESSDFPMYQSCLSARIRRE